MRRFLFAALVLPAMFALVRPVRSADDGGAAAIVDKAIQAIGGEAKLKAAKGATWKTKGKITFGDNESDFTSTTTVAGMDHFRQEFEAEFGGNKVQGVVVVSGDKGWRKFGENNLQMDAEAIANEKRVVYLQVAPGLLTPLKGNDFKLEAGGEQKIGDAEAAAVKATGPDGKDFTLYFDKTSGLLLKLSAKIIGFGGQEFLDETTYRDYQEFGGIKRASKVESKRDGQRFIESETTEFKLLDQVDPATFTEPK
ncbi:MAG TPA: hypothetical protein VF306_14575 [Pirellulales bacterium]